MNDPKYPRSKMKYPACEVGSSPFGWLNPTRDKIVLHIEERNGYVSSMQMNNWQNQVRQREAALEAQRTQLEGKEREVEALRKGLLEQKNEADARERALQEWERCLKEKESDLNSAASQRQEMLHSAALRYERERNLWEEKVVSSRQEDAVEESLGTLRQEFVNLYKKITEVKGELVNLGDVVRDSACPGVEALCGFYRDLSIAAAGNEQFGLLADKLGVILQYEFQAEVIEPRPGDVFDPVTCELVDNTCRGSRITSCLARGWRWRDEIKLRAVVETAEDVEVS